MSDAGRYSGQEKPTTPLDKTDIIEGLLRSMQREVQDGFASSKAEVGKLSADVHMLIEDRRLVHDRIGMLEERMRRASGTVKAVTEADVEQSRSLAEETQKRKAIESELLATREQLEAVNEKIAVVTKELEDAKALAADTKLLAEEAKALAEDTKSLTEDTKSLTVAQSAELERQTATLNRLATIASNPVVKDLARAVGTAILTLILGWLAAGGHK